MNKLSIVGLIIASGILSVSALEQVNNKNPKGMMPQAKARVATSTKQVVKEPRMLPPEMQIPVTGDPVVDAKIKALTEEMQVKIKAINDEYKTKILAVVGSRPLKMAPNLGNRASTTPRMDERALPGRVASSTREGNGGVNQDKGERPPQAQPQTGKQNQPRPQPQSMMPGFQQFGSLFQKMFGGNN